MLPVHQQLLCVTIVVGIFTHACRAQDLAPRAYFITPLRSNAITLAWPFFDGSIDYNGVIPISDASYEAIVGGELDTVSDTVLQFTGDQPLSLSRYFRKHPEFLNNLR